MWQMGSLKKQFNETATSGKLAFEHLISWDEIISWAQWSEVKKICSHELLEHVYWVQQAMDQ